MEKVARTFNVGKDTPETVVYPKYMWPNVLESETNVAVIFRGYKLCLMKKTYYPIRDINGELHFVPITTRGDYMIEKGKDLKKIKEDFNKEFENEVYKFIFFNNFHKMTGEEIEKFNTI